MPTRQWFTLVLSVLACLLFAGAAAGAAPAARPLADDSVALAEVMLTRLNEARHDSGLRPYTLNPILTEIAFAHARVIAANNHYSHTGLDGRTPKDRARDAGYGAGREQVRIGENFVGRQHLDDGFQWLMEDPPHRANMLDPNFREVGVGAARIAYGYIWVLAFGSYAGIDEALANPPTATPPPTEPPTATPVPPTETATETPTSTATATVATPVPADRAPAATAIPGSAMLTFMPPSASEGTNAAPDATQPDASPNAGEASGTGAPSSTSSGASRTWLWLGLLAIAGVLVAVWAWRRGQAGG